MEFSSNYRGQMRAVKVEYPEFTGMSPTRKVTLEMGTLPRHEYYEDDVVLVKRKQQSALNEADCAEWAAALGWDDAMPALVDLALVFAGTPPPDAVCTRWVKDPSPLAVEKMGELKSDAFYRNRIFELLIRKGDDHQWNTLSSDNKRHWWSIDHDEVDLITPGVTERNSRMGNVYTDEAVASKYGQDILRGVLNRTLPEVLRERVETLIVPRGT